VRTEQTCLRHQTEKSVASTISVVRALYAWPQKEKRATQIIKRGRHVDPCEPIRYRPAKRPSHHFMFSVPLEKLPLSKKEKAKCIRGEEKEANVLYD
jgi:hypothetical protein